MKLTPPREINTSEVLYIRHLGIFGKYLCKDTPWRVST